MKNVESVYPLSPVQEGMLFHGLYAPGTEEYLLQLRCGLRGPLDVGRFRAAWGAVQARHEGLRTSVVWEGVPRAVQVVHREVTLPWAEEDWTGRSTAAQTARVEAYLQWDRATGFAVTRAPLWRLWLLRRDAEAYEFVWSAHHLVVDGWSSAQVLAEVLADYAGQPVAAASGTYREYVTWLQQQDGAAAERYWRGALRGFGTPTALGPRGALLRRYGEVACRVPSEVLARLEGEARSWQVTLSTVVLGAWGLLLSRYSGRRDVVFGATTTERPAGVTGIDGIVGVFINTLPVRLQVPRGEAVGAWLQQVQRAQVEARQYSYSPLVAVQGWSEVPRGTALFESLVVMANYPVAAAVRRGVAGAVQVTEVAAFERTSYPLTVMVRAGAGLALTLIYDRGRYAAAWAQAAVTQLGQVLGVLADGLRSPVQTIAVVRGRARREVVGAWNRTAQRVRPGTVSDWIWATAARRPAAVAVAGGETWTYGRLVARAEAVAAALHAQGVGPEAVVAVTGPRTPALVAGVLGVLRAGAAYLPLDVQTPPVRAAHMLAEAQVRAVVTAGGAVAPAGVPAVVVERVPRAAPRPAPVLAPDHLAYLIYTSGSTGQPKGVMATHGGLANALDAFRADELVKEDDVLLALTTISFDIAALELLLPLIVGARLVIADSAMTADPISLRSLIEEQQVTVIQGTPTHWRLLCDGGCITPGLRALCGGEALPADLARDLFDRGAVLTNLYGPTETTIWSSLERVKRVDGGRAADTQGERSSDMSRRDAAEAAESTVPIGRPIANTRLHVLDRDGDLAPIGAVGQLFIGGAGLARGYVGRPDLTAERFLPDPLGVERGGRLYDTGDLAQHRPDGVLEYVGRRDFQLKIRGVRIEPGEVEAHLRGHPDVRQAAVTSTAAESTPAQRLVAYVVAAPGQQPTPEGLRRYLAERVIDQMIPALFVFLDALPLTPNGKLNRAALPAIADEPATPAGEEIAFSPLEESIAAIWRRVLRVQRVGREDNFFDKGGHSLLVIEVRNAIRDELGIELTIVDLFTYPTVRALAERLATEPPRAVEESARTHGARRRQAVADRAAIAESHP